MPNHESHFDGYLSPDVPQLWRSSQFFETCSCQGDPISQNFSVVKPEFDDFITKQTNLDRIWDRIFGGPLILQKFCLQCFVDLLEMGKLGEWMTVKTRRTPRLKGRLIIVSRQKGKAKGGCCKRGEWPGQKLHCDNSMALFWRQKLLKDQSRKQFH